MKKIVSQQSRAIIVMAEICRYLPAGCLWPVSCVVGAVLYYTNAKRRKQVIRAYERLRELAGIETDARTLAWRCYLSQFFMMAITYIMQDAPPSRWEKLVRIEGYEAVEDVLKQGRGMVLGTLHFGSNLMTLAYLTHRGHDISIMRPKYMDKIQSRGVRRMLYLTAPVLYVGESRGLGSPLRAGIKLLRQNTVLGIAMDGDQGEDIVQAPFFGRGYPVHLGILEIARLSRAPLIFTLGVVAGGRLLVKYFPPRDIPEGDAARPVLDQYLADSMRQFEETVRAYPECAWWTRPICEAVGVTKATGTDASPGQAQEE